jgi:hypothetical protein
VPTPDHYLPLLYVAGTRISSEPLTFPVEGVDGGSVLLNVGPQPKGYAVKMPRFGRRPPVRSLNPCTVVQDEALRLCAEPS